MKVFVLGGSGKVGREAVQLLARSDLVTQIAVAGRNLERAQDAAGRTGGKGTAVHSDGGDAGELARQLAGYDLVVNCAHDDTVLTTIRAAIQAGANYCDVNSVIEDALDLASEAEAAGITAIVANGIGPGVSNLMGVHGARQLDEVQQLQRGMADLLSDDDPEQELAPRQWLEGPDESRALVHGFRPFMTWMLYLLKENGARMMLDHQHGHWVDVDPVRSGVDVPHDGSGPVFSYPFVSFDSFWRGLPTDLSEVPPMEMWFSTLPPRLDAVLREQALHVLEEDVDPETAISAFFDVVDRDPHQWLTAPGDVTPVPWMWVRAVGRKDGRPARYDCWFTPPPKVTGWFITSVALSAAALKILRGETKKRGVMTAEKAFDPLSFFEEAAALLPGPPRDGRLVDESFHWLE